MNLREDQLRRYLGAVDADAKALARALTLAGVAVERVFEADGASVLETDITTNRPDLLSYLGTARELATLFRTELRPPEVTPPEGDLAVAAAVSVEVADSQACPRYVARVVSVDAGAAALPAPAPVRQVLEAAGLRPIGLVVDITNFVLLELGHPIHAFDLARVAQGAIRVRRAVTGERLRTLDGIERTLDAADLVIADPERALALAGVMGGADSEITARSREVLIESACFDPVAVRRTARRHGLRTEASLRFERGANREACGLACDRAARLLAELASGRVRKGRVDVRQEALPRPRIDLRLARLAALLGIAVEPEEARRILIGLGCSVGGAAPVLEVEPPTFRADLSREVDLIEEVGRHHGYGAVPALLPSRPLPPPGRTVRQLRERALRSSLAGLGWSEAVTLSLVDPARERLFLPAGVEPVALENPLSDRLAALRATVVAGLVESLAINLRRGAEGVALFELARVFRPGEDGRPLETLRLGLAASGTRRLGGSAWPVDELHLKGALDAAAQALGLPPVGAGPGPTPGAPALLSFGGAPGMLWRLPVTVLAACDLDRHGPVFVAEVDLQPALESVPPPVRILAPSRFPAAVRDVSLFVRDASYADVLDAFRGACDRTVEDLRLVDRFVHAGRVSMTLRVTYRDPERTLEADEVQRSHARLLAALAADPRFELRGPQAS